MTTIRSAGGSDSALMSAVADDRQAQRRRRPTAIGVGVSFAPRPAGRSGCVTTWTTSCAGVRRRAQRRHAELAAAGEEDAQVRHFESDGIDEIASRNPDALFPLGLLLLVLLLEFLQRAAAGHAWRRGPCGR